VVCAAAVFFLFLAEDPDDNPASGYQETAINRVRATMRDPNAKIENVVFHPVPGPGPEGRSYACGYARPSTDNNVRSERFIYYFGLDTVSFIEQLRDRDHIASAASLCNSAALPLDRFDLSDGKMSLKTNRK
jgi:hypothetical protein